MAKEAEKKPGILQRATELFRLVPGGSLIFAVLPAVILGYLGWYYYGAEHFDQTLYSLKREKLDVTPQPEWVTGDLTQEVFDVCGLDRISLLDPHANKTIAQAFESHNWVKSVIRVTKASTGQVSVSLAFRRPAAMVYFGPLGRSLNANTSPAAEKGFYPVDAEALLLPGGDDFGGDVFDYFQIYANGARPSADSLGKPFGDVRVHEAVKLAVALEPVRRELDLSRIYVDPDNQSMGPSPWTLVLETTNQARQIAWGHAPGAEAAGEPSVEQKVQILRQWVNRPGTTLSIGTQPLTIDLRTPRAGAAVSLRQ